MAKSKEFNLDALQSLQNLTIGTNYVQRWQGTPQLLPYNVSTHAYNCAMLYMQICFVCKHSMDVRLTCALLCHDNMEALTGDLLAPAKDSAPDYWNSIEQEVQTKWRKDNKVYASMARAFLPIEEDFALYLTESSMHLLKIIDMLEFLLHVHQEYRAGNRSDKIMEGLKYGGASLKRRINTAQSAFKEPDLLDILTCIRYYYNRQLNDLALNGEFYV